jgi:uncharacterized protein YbjT (DUF2867 family)
VGGTSFLGFRVVAALIEFGADVSVMVRPDREDRLQGLRQHINIIHADVWNKASLKGRARGHHVIVHLIGSTHADPTRGYTYQQINLVSARHVTSMAVSDGVPSMILLSAVARPELSGEYIYSKREAEEYLVNSGLQWTIIRAPALYTPQQIGIRLLTRVSTLFPFGMLFGNFMPIAVDAAARGIARIALRQRNYHEWIIYANTLRRLARERNPYPVPSRLFNLATSSDDDPEGLNEPPFGWLPPTPRRY